MAKQILLIFLSFFIVALPLNLKGQNKNINVQHGIVCTPVNPSHPSREVVPGLRVVINGAMGKPTNEKGEFNMQVNGSYQVNGVDSKDYILIAPKHAKIPDNNLLEVVVISNEQKGFVTKERYKALQKQYRKQGEEYIETRNLLQEALDSLEESDARYHELKAKYEEVRDLYIKHIEDEDKIFENLRSIAEELAMTDFQTLDTLQKNVFELRWNGDWEEVEKYIRSTMMESPEVELQRIRQSKSLAEEQVDVATAKLKEGLIARKTAEQQEKDWFFKIESLIEMYKVRHENDSVSKYYKILTDADPQNWNYLEEAGLFERDYLSHYDVSLEYLKRALSLEPSDSVIWRTYSNIGVSYESKCEHQKALEYFNLAKKICHEIYGENCFGLAKIYANIGKNKWISGLYQEALSFYENALDVFLNLGEENNLEIGKTYHNMGVVYSDIDNYILALDFYEKGLERLLNSIGENDIEISRCLNNIGELYLKQGEYNKALDYFQKSLTIGLEVFGENHDLIALIYKNLGRLCQLQEDFDNAINYHEKELSILSSIFGENHTSVAGCFNEIGQDWFKIGNFEMGRGNQEKAQENYDIALGFFERALIIDLEKLDERDLSIASLYNNIGNVYAVKNELDKALELYDKALQLRLTLLENHSEIADSYNNIGVLYMVKNENDKAIEYFEKGLQILLSLFQVHPSIADSYRNIGYLYAAKEDNDKAIEYLEKSKKMYIEIFSEDSPQVLQIQGIIEYLMSQQVE